MACEERGKGIGWEGYAGLTERGYRLGRGDIKVVEAVSRPADVEADTKLLLSTTDYECIVLS
jgi:hypothetical protein